MHTSGYVLCSDSIFDEFNPAPSDCKSNRHYCLSCLDDGDYAKDVNCETGCDSGYFGDGTYCKECY